MQTEIKAYVVQEAIKLRDIEIFAEEFLGIPSHKGHKIWYKNSTKLINILKPANQWGKTTAEAVKHIYHAMCKPQMDRFNPDFQTWFDTRYQTLNFGLTYEVAKGVQEAIMDIVEGRYLLPNGKFNKSLLEGWAITGVTEHPKLPKIKWFNNSETLIRSYDGLGAAFKRLKLAFISGDECGDIPELILFLNGTLLPRVSFFKGTVDLVGTSQPKGLEYEELAELAHTDMKNRGEDATYFIISADSDPEIASVFTNEFMPQEHLKMLEGTADPELRKQIIYGQYVDSRKKLYSFEEVSHMFMNDMPYNPETGFSEAPVEGGYYAFATDLAASEDETSMTCIRYNITSKLSDGKLKYHPHRVVFHKAWKGDEMPLTLQYELIASAYMQFKMVSPKRCRFIYDAGSLGGKNAGQAFRKLSGYPFPPKGRSYAEIKAEMFGKIKEVLGRGREFDVMPDGSLKDRNHDWGGIKASPRIKELRRQIESASKDDAKLKNDQFTSFGMALHFVEARAPKITHTRAIDFNLSRATL